MTLQIEVEDTGIGIAPEHRDRLFRPFSQVDDSVTRQYGGTGLGLNISRQLARLMGGDLELAWSEMGKGSCFRLLIDVGNPALLADGVSPDFQNTLRSDVSQWPLPRTDSSPAKLKFPKGARVLVVDDSPENQTLMKLYLSKLGLDSDAAYNGVEAIQKVVDQSFQLVLMDVQMPVLDGLEATRRLRGLGYQIPIVALTAHAMKEDVDKSLLAGCNSHLAKPIDRQDLIRVLQFHIKCEPLHGDSESQDI